MNRETIDWKSGLKQAFDEAGMRPDHEKKHTFIRTLSRPKMRIREFVFTQMGYIHPWVWCISGAVFAIALVGAVFFRASMLWMISAMTPVLALTILTESGRSESYRMSELEMATRFSLKSVILAKFGILGCMDMVLLVILIPLAAKGSRFDVVLTGLSIVSPFLLTSCSGLWIVRRFRGKESMYICVAIACFVSVCSLVFHTSLGHIFMKQLGFEGWWIAGTVLLAAGTMREGILLIRGTEELSWS